MNNSNKQIKYGAIISYVSIIINIVLSLIYLPWLVSSIGKSQYALYSLAGTFINMFLVDFGLSQATSRFLSKYRADKDKEKDKDLPEKLRSESDKILGWCIQGFLKYQQLGDLIKPQALDDAKSRYKTKMDIISQRTV